LLPIILERFNAKQLTTDSRLLESIESTESKINSLVEKIREERKEDIDERGDTRANEYLSRHESEFYKIISERNIRVRADLLPTLIEEENFLNQLLSQEPWSHSSELRQRHALLRKRIKYAQEHNFNKLSQSYDQAITERWKNLFYYHGIGIDVEALQAFRAQK